MTTDTFAEAFLAVVDYCEAKGASPLDRHEGCYEADVDEVWSIAVNGHRVPEECGQGSEVAPFHCAVFWRGHLAGILHPYGGELAAHENASEDLFIAALEAAS